MGSMVELFKGRVGLGDNAMGGIQQMINAEMSNVVRDEIRPLRELTMAVMVQFQEATEMIKALTTQLSIVTNKDSIPQLEMKPSLPVAQKISGLGLEKAGSEVLATLFDKMINEHPAKLRPFYTDLERDSGVGITALHKGRTSDIRSGEVGKYPYRKVDTVLLVLEADYVFKYAKSYKFTCK